MSISHAPFRAPLQSAVALAVILLPFNALPYFRNLLGELSYEGAFYPPLVGVVCWAAMLAVRSKLSLPTHLSARLLALFLIWIVVSATINAPDLIESVTKGRTGIEKFLLQVLLVGFTATCSVFVFNALICTDSMLRRVRAWTLTSFFICGLYAAVELGKLLGLTGFADVLFQVDRFIRDSDNLAAYADLGRLRSVSGEASWFAMYCAFVTPWILSYLYSERRLRWWHPVVVAYLLVLVALTWSRAAYVITSVQLLVFIIGATRVVPDVETRTRGRFVTIGVVFLFTASAVFTISVFEQTVFLQRSLTDILVSLLDADNLSNVGRIGSQVAAIRIAVENPLFGVGLGQYGFHMPQAMPGWALGSSEVANWMSSSVDSPWAPAHGLYSRMAAELGFVGLILWLAVWAGVVYGILQRLRSQHEGARDERVLALALLTSIVGVLLAGLNADSLRFFGYWIALAIAWAYMQAGPMRDGTG